MFSASIDEAEKMGDTDAPLRMQIVAMIAYRFDTAVGERKNSHVFVRINAFSSRAVLGRPFGAIRIGMPVRGALELTEIGYGSDQLVGRPLLSIILHLLVF